MLLAELKHKTRAPGAGTNKNTGFSININKPVIIDNEFLEEIYGCHELAVNQTNVRHGAF